LCGASVGAVACSDTPTNPIPPVSNDSGVTPDTNTVKPDGSVNPGTDGGGGTDSGGGVDSGSCAVLKPASGKAAFCPFQAKVDAGGVDSGLGPNCAQGSTCCAGQKGPNNGPFDPTVCAIGGADKCPAPTNPAFRAEGYECTEADDCATGVCCINPFKAGTAPSLDSYLGCTTLKGDLGTRCKATCGADELQGCQTVAECGAGKTCVPINVGPGGSTTKAPLIFMGYCK
jgi:hypothetical protein